MDWINIKRDFPSGAIVISSEYGVKSYFFLSKREAEKKYRKAFGLKNKKLKRI